MRVSDWTKEKFRGLHVGPYDTCTYQFIAGVNFFVGRKIGMGPSGYVTSCAYAGGGGGGGGGC